MAELREVREICEGLLHNALFKALLAVLLTAFHWTFGNEATPVLVMLALMVMDGITGVWKACALKELSSRGFRRGAMKFCVYAILMTAAALVDKVLSPKIWLTGMTAFLAITEFISIMENVAVMGWPVPTALLKTLKILQEKK